MPLSMIAAALLAGPALQAAPLTPGTVTVAPLAADQGPAEIRRTIASEVERALMDVNFTALPPGGQGRYTARVSISRTPRGQVTANGRENRANPLVGNWGAGLSVTMPSNKTQLRGLIVTELTIELIRRGESAPAWTGRAATAQAEGTANDAPAALGRKLATAVLRQFPAGSGEVVAVP